MSQGKTSRAFRITKDSLPPRKKTTPSHKNHQFASFSQRIGGLKIDPVRKTNPRDFALESNESYFKTALDQWKDRNLSASFTTFVHEVEPLCDNLPQILHYQHAIKELLKSYLEKRDAYSLEPLLALVPSLAHDLGAKFEIHFQEIVQLVSNLAATHQNVEVIEWSFNCLAWLFKYLARLLVPDLRPLYRIMSSLLGRTRQKDFVVRFAAEALSFLVRKAALSPEKSHLALERLAFEAFQDLKHTEGERKLDLQNGLRVMFAESAKGVQGELSSGGSVIVRALLDYSIRVFPQDIEVRACVENALVDITLHVSGHSLELLVETVCATMNLIPETRSSSDSDQPFGFDRSCDLLLALSGTMGAKKNSIPSWIQINELGTRIVKVLSDPPDSFPSESATLAFNLLSTILVYSPLEAMRSLSKSMDELDASLWTIEFLKCYCLVQYLNQERCKSFLFKTLQWYV